jgi:hypothetical protein
MVDHSHNAQIGGHWSWHVLIAAAVLLFGIGALLYQVGPAYKQLDHDRQRLLAGLCLMAGMACLLPWSLRRTLSRDWRITLARHRYSTTPLVRDITPVVVPLWLQGGLWFSLALWMAWVALSLTVDDRAAARMTLENGLLQDLTVICYAIAAVLLFRTLLLAVRSSALPGLRRWWLLILIVGCLGVAGEEINWGQSILDFETPEVLIRTNIQQEVSLHNLELPGLPGRHWSNDVLFAIALLGGAVMPLSLLASAQARRLAAIAEFPLPPWISQGYFLAAALIPRDGDMLGQLSRDNIPSELREVTIACSMLIWAWALWRQQTATPTDPADHSRDGGRDETQIHPA